VSAASHPPSVPLPQLAAFALHVGETFVLRVGERQSLDVDLVEARSRRPSGSSATATDRPFSLVFLSRGPAPLPQRIYRLEHPTLGAMELFLVPLGPQGGRMRFEAVFN
jgi:hypothetical protein